MTSNNDIIEEQINKGNNILFYQEELYALYQKRNKKHNAIYISTPKKGKTAFEQILKKINQNTQTKNKTISKLLEEITEQTKNNPLIIYINHFEQMSNRELQNYRELEEQSNIYIIANIEEDKEFIDEEFLKRFVILNESEYYNNRSQSINIKFVILLLLSLLVFLLFLRIQLSAIRFMVSALWFTLLMYRSFYYISH